MDVENPLLDEPDVISRLMNGRCANHLANACGQQEKLSSQGLWLACSAVGIKPDRHLPRSTSLTDKLKLQCEDLQPLSNGTGLENIFGTIEELGTRLLVRANNGPMTLTTSEHGLWIFTGGYQATESGLCASFQDRHHGTASNDPLGHAADVVDGLELDRPERSLCSGGYQGGISPILNTEVRSHLPQPSTELLPSRSQPPRLSNATKLLVKIQTSKPAPPILCEDTSPQGKKRVVRMST